MSDQPQVVPFARRKGIGPINKRNIDIQCLACGNTQTFVGTAHVHPSLILSREPNGKYEVQQMQYLADDKVDETVEMCGRCGSAQLQITERASEEVAADAAPDAKTPVSIDDDIPW